MLRIAVCVSALMFGMSAAADTPASPPTASEAPSENVRLRVDQISGYNVIDNRNIIVTAPTRSRTYLISTRNKCHDLKFGEAIAFKTAGVNRVDRFTRIVPLDRIAGFSPCYVDSVTRVENREAAEALIEARAVAQTES